MLNKKFAIIFAHKDLKWNNLAKNNAGVTVNIIGFGEDKGRRKTIFSDNNKHDVNFISPYLVPAATGIVVKRMKPLSDIGEMRFGSMPIDGGFLLLSAQEKRDLIDSERAAAQFIKPIFGSQEMINGEIRYCIWVTDRDLAQAKLLPRIVETFDEVCRSRSESKRVETQKLASNPYKFGFISQNGSETVIAVPAISSENREYLPVNFYNRGTIITNRNYGIFDAPLWNASILMSKMHLAWVATVCGRLEMRFSYTNTLGWNTFPVPSLTAQDKADLTHCAEGILLAREAHFPRTIAELYEPDAMPDDLRRAHERNDETLERIYVGRCFRNDTERLEHLFALYTKMTASDGAAGKKGSSKSPRKSRSAEKVA
jgi:hypothetical protein